MVSSQAQGRIGSLPTLSTDAAPGFSRMVYESAVIAMRMLDAGKFILVHFEGTVAKARDAPKSDLGQVATMGHCPCFARALHTATPPMYRLGEYSRFG